MYYSICISDIEISCPLFFFFSLAEKEVCPAGLCSLKAGQSGLLSLSTIHRGSDQMVLPARCCRTEDSLLFSHLTYNDSEDQAVLKEITMNQISNRWKEYEVLDAGNKTKLERWKNIILDRPDPVAIWPREDEQLWKKADAVYHRSSKGGGQWEFRKPLEEFWTIRYGELLFKISPTGFKHTGLFPEQAANWDFIMNSIRTARADGREDIKVLNLFAYTGGATMAAAKAGASEVVHLDASKGINQWARENMMLNHLEDRKIRFLVDDVMKFIRREIRRGRKYDAIIMDPPSYGRGPNGEVWKIEDSIFDLISEASQLLSDNALFFLVNIYSTGFPLSSLQQTMDKILVRQHGGSVETGETLLPITSGGVLPCGQFGRWTSSWLAEHQEPSSEEEN